MTWNLSNRWGWVRTNQRRVLGDYYTTQLLCGGVSSPLVKQHWRWNDPIYDDSLKIGGGDSNMFLFQPHFEEDSHLDEHICSKGLIQSTNYTIWKVDGTTPKRWRKVRGHDKPIHGGWAIYFPCGLIHITPNCIHTTWEVKHTIHQIEHTTYTTLYNTIHTIQVVGWTHQICWWYIAWNRFQFPQKPPPKFQRTEIFCSTKRLCNQRLGVRNRGTFDEKMTLEGHVCGVLEIWLTDLFIL